MLDLRGLDLEDIAGVFREPLPRIGLDSLPDQGAWLQPFRPLSGKVRFQVIVDKSDPAAQPLPRAEVELDGVVVAPDQFPYRVRTSPV